MKTICLPRRNQSSFWAFCSSRLTFFLNREFGNWSCSEHQQSSRPASHFLDIAFQKRIARTWIPLMNHPSPLLWPITLLPTDNQNRIAVPKFAVFAVQPQNSAETPTSIIELIVDGLLANVGIGIVSLFCLSSLAKTSPRPCSLWNWPSLSLLCARVNSLRMISGWIKRRKLITKNVFLWSRCTPCVMRQAFVAARHGTRTWNHWLEA